MMVRRGSHPRRGAAAVEVAVVSMVFVLPLMVGVWEAGRLVQVQQVVSNAAREGARLAAQGVTVSAAGAPTQVLAGSPDPAVPNVQDAVYQYLIAAGFTTLQKSDVTVTFAFQAGRTTDYVPLSTDPPGLTFPAGSRPPHPCYGDKNQPFTVSVSVPWEKVRWVNLGVLRPATVDAAVTWRMLADDPFVVNPALPAW